MRMNLALGTVQFGLPYGATNYAGQVGKDDARSILDEAFKSGITMVDTAASYGTSENILGALIGSDPRFKVITKTIALPNDVSNKAAVDQLIARFESSLTLLRRTSVYGLLCHHAADLVGPAGDMLFERLGDLRAQGKVTKLGVSVYESKEAEALIKRYPIEIMQLPVNVLDQRMLQSNTLELLQSRNVEVHARSAFLQGILLSLPDRWKNVPEGLVEPVHCFQKDMTEAGISALQGALGFMRSLPIDTIVVGTTSAQELKAISSAWVASLPGNIKWKKYGITSPLLVDPRRW